MFTFRPFTLARRGQTGGRGEWRRLAVKVIGNAADQQLLALDQKAGRLETVAGAQHVLGAPKTLVDQRGRAAEGGGDLLGAMVPVDQVQAASLDVRQLQDPGVELLWRQLQHTADSPETQGVFDRLP